MTIKHYKVLTKLSKILCFTGDCNVGDLVKVRVRNTSYYGIVVRHCNIKHKFKLQTAIFIHSCNKEYLDFLRKFSNENGVLLRKVCRSFFPYISERFLTRPIVNIDQTFSSLNLQLAEKQQNAKNEFIWNKCNLLWGVTGSGKTELSISLIYDQLKKDPTSQILILVPEISLLHNMLDRIKKYMSFTYDIWHSKCKSKSIFARILKGESSIVIGARSALFLPFKNLKMIIVDEEHDVSYKQLSMPCYHITSVLPYRKKNISILLMSATPSIKTLSDKSIHKIHLSSSFKPKDIQISHVTINEYDPINKEIISKISNTLDKKEQVMILCNRRGFGTFVVCDICKKRQTCKICQRVLSFHHNLQSNRSSLRCNHCNKSFSWNKCVFCGSHAKTIGGYGVEKLFSLLSKHFDPEMITIFSSDYCKTSEQIQNILHDIHNENKSIIIGTQMLLKGHDIKKLSRVIVFPHNLHSYDFRMAETLSQNLTQIMGRVGRDGRSCEIILCSRNIREYQIMENLLNYPSLVKSEMEIRKKNHLPPYGLFFMIEFTKKNDIKTVYYDLLPHDLQLQVFHLYGKYYLRGSFQQKNRMITLLKKYYSIFKIDFYPLSLIGLE